MGDDSGNGRKPDGKFAPGNKAGAGRKTLRKTARELFKNDLNDAVIVLRILLRDRKRPELQLAAAKMVIEHSLGKPIASNIVATAAGASGEGTMIDSIREELRRASESFTVTLTTRPDDDSAAA